MIVNRLTAFVVNRAMLFGARSALLLQVGTVLFLLQACTQNAGSSVAHTPAARSGTLVVSRRPLPSATQIISSQSSCVPPVGSAVDGPHIVGVVRMYLSKDILNDVTTVDSKACHNTPSNSCLAITTARLCTSTSKICAEDDDNGPGLPLLPGRCNGNPPTTSLDVNVTDATRVPLNMNAVVLIKAYIYDDSILYSQGQTGASNDSSYAITYSNPVPTNKMLSCRSDIMTDPPPSGHKYITFRVVPHQKTTFNDIDLGMAPVRNPLLRLTTTFDPKIMHQ